MRWLLEMGIIDYAEARPRARNQRTENMWRTATMRRL